jgi:CheY-like chemotaxis protein
MSHEMRTPMNAIIGMTKIAEKTDDVSRLKHCLSIINTSSVHLLGIINDVLDMSKIEAGKFELEKIPMNIEKMLMKVSNIIIDNIEKKNQKLNVQMPEDLDLNYIADDLRLSQVVTNLLANAIKFTPENGNITLSVEKIGSKGNVNTLRFTVTDTGIGMTEEQITRLFNAFEQADGSISRKFGGTGLGLAISKNIIEKMDGRIWVESKQGAGSSFIFEVNLERAPDQEGPGRKSPETGTDTSVEIPDLSGVNIILAEDMEINREIFIALLEDTHVTIDSAENGLIAVSKFRENPEKYNLIIMDVQMPEMDGYQATRTIRAMDTPKAKNIPIIAMTANAFKEDVDRCLEAGMNDHLAKPIDEKNVIEKIMRYSGRFNPSSISKQEPLPTELINTAWQG